MVHIYGGNNMVNITKIVDQIRLMKCGLFSERKTHDDVIDWLESAISAESGYRPAAMTAYMMGINTTCEMIAKAIENEISKID